MKVRVNEKIVVEVKITKTMECPAGTAYYNIDYMIDGVCIHNATTGAIYGAPNPIEMLDRQYTWTEYHYEDIPNPDPRPAKYTGAGSSNGRPAWWIEKSKTHRQAIIDAVSQIVSE
jgi:hypothetical protein